MKRQEFLQHVALVSFGYLVLALCATAGVERLTLHDYSSAVALFCLGVVAGVIPRIEVRDKTADDT